jgi:hypothetical protein
MTAAILYGFAEGPALAPRLIEALSRQAIVLAADPAHADLIIVHSGGIFELPPNIGDKTILLVAPSYGHGHAAISMLVALKIWLDFKSLIIRGEFGIWAKKIIINLTYIPRQLKRTAKMYAAIRRRTEILPELHARQVIVVKYTDDPWSSLIGLEETTKHPNYTFIELAGSHDELWIHPEPTVAVVFRRPEYLHDMCDPKNGRT